MPKYLWRASYTQEGVQGLLREGGSSRRDAVTRLVEEQGGSIEAFYYAFGDADVVVVADLPDDATAAAVSLTGGASGAVAIGTTRPLTVDEIDQATPRSVSYRPPGG